MNKIKADDKGIHRTFEHKGHTVSGYAALWGEEIAPNMILARDAEVRLPDGHVLYGPDHPKHKTP